MEQDAPSTLLSQPPFSLLIGDVFHVVDEATLVGPQR